MIVGFFRHGIAVERGTRGVAEEERALTPEGRRKTARAARGLRRLDLGFDAIYTSPLRRAIQTADLLADALRLGKPEILEALLPEAPGRRLLEQVLGLEEKSPLLVGHEPQLSATVSTAICGDVKASIEMKKAGLAVLDLGPSSAVLRLLLTPGALRKLGR